MNSLFLFFNRISVLMRSFAALFLFSIFLSSFGQEYSILSIPPELTKNSNSVVIEEIIDIDATNIRRMTISTRRVVAVLNKLGIGDSRAYEFYNENSRVKKIEAEVYDAFGNRNKRFKKKDFLDVSRSGENMYADSRVLYLEYIPTSYPYIMVFESEVETGDSALLQNHHFLHGYAESVRKTEMTIQYHPDAKVRYKGKNLEGYDVTISETPNKLTIRAENIPAFRHEEYSPSQSEIFPHVLLTFNKFQLKNVMATVTNWEDFGIWMHHTLLSDVNDISDKTIAEINRLIQNETTQEAKAKKIYQYVQDKVRYVSIQIGIGGWKPMPASEVDKLGYGDCKALTNYTKVLLDAVGIPSYYTIVYGNQTPQNIDEDFASIQGNHVILGIPEGDKITWLECTSQSTPYGYIGSFTDDRNVVIITPEGGKLSRTKLYNSEENKQITHAAVQINRKGEIQVKFESTSKGLQYEDKYLLEKRKESEIDQYYKNRWNHINGFTIGEYDFYNNREDVKFTEKLTLNLQNYTTAVGNDFLLAPNIFNQHNTIPPKISERKQKLKINRGYTDEDFISIEIPSNMQVESLPESVSLKNTFGTYETNFQKITNTYIAYHRRFHLKKGEYSPEEYDNFRLFLREVSQADRTKILLTKTTNE